MTSVSLSDALRGNFKGGGNLALLETFPKKSLETFHNNDIIWKDNREKIEKISNCFCAFHDDISKRLGNRSSTKTGMWILMKVFQCNSVFVFA